MNPNILSPPNYFTQVFIQNNCFSSKVKAKYFVEGLILLIAVVFLGNL